MPFSAQNRLLEDLWGNSTKKYVVPRYQREYSWGTDEVDNLWNDLFSDDEFFLGSIVLNVGNGQDRTEIIDGQQRMLTMTILHAAIRDTAHELGLETQADRIHRAEIYRSGAFGGGHYIVDPAPSLKDYLRRSVQKYPDPNFNNPRSKEEKLVRTNYEFFKKKLKLAMERFSSEDEIQTGLGEIDSKLKNTMYIRIEVQDGYDAYRIFETMNARGVDLTVADLIKNMIFRQIGVEEDGTDVAKEKWDRIKGNLGNTPFDLARFVRYHWISSTSTVTRGKLYREIKEKTSDTAWEDLLNSLESDSELLSQLTRGVFPNPNNSSEINEINAGLKSISKLGSIQCYVLLLSLFRNREMLDISMNTIKEIVQKLESFIFSYHTVCRKPANTVEKYYSELAVGINQLGPDEESRQRLRSRIAELYTKLGSLWPGRHEFIEKFCNIEYKNSSVTKKKVRYILTKFENHKHPRQMHEVSINENISIEHLLPQNPKNWNLAADEVSEYVHLIGNLLLVGVPINSEASNFPLERKASVLHGSRIQSTVELIEELEARDSLYWNREDIEERGRKLAEISYDEIWAR